jgi:plastocyanin domain-containing protein
LYVLVDAKGFSPREIPVKAGEVTEVFVMRTTEATCVNEIIVPDLGVRLPLPLDQPVKFSVKPPAPGRINFGCAEGHVTGEIVIR